MKYEKIYVIIKDAINIIFKKGYVKTMKKRIFITCLCFILSISALVSCGKSQTEDGLPQETSSVADAVEAGARFDEKTEYYGYDSSTNSIFSVKSGKWTFASKTSHLRHEGELSSGDLLCTHENSVDAEYEVLENESVKVTIDNTDYIFKKATASEYATNAQLIFKDAHFIGEEIENNNKKTTTIPVAKPDENPSDTEDDQGDPNIGVVTAAPDDLDPDAATDTNTAITTTGPVVTVPPSNVEAYARMTLGYFSDKDDHYLLEINDGGSDDGLIVVNLQILKNNPLYYSDEDGGFKEIYYMGNSYTMNAGDSGDDYDYHMTLVSGGDDKVPVTIYWTAPKSDKIKVLIVHGSYSEEIEMDGSM